MSQLAKLFRQLAELERTEIPWDLIEKFRNKKKCVHVYEHTGIEYACIYCGVFRPMPVYILDKQNLIDFWPRSYARKQYFDSMFKKLSGLELLTLSDDCMIELTKAVPSPGDWYEVYHTYRKFDLKEWWTGWNHHRPNVQNFGLKPSHHQLLLYIDSQWDHGERVKKKINVYYCLFKIVQLKGDPTDWVPMKLRCIAITRLDKEWQSICKKFNWKFIPTEKSLAKILW